MEPQMQKFVEAVEKELTAEDIDTSIEGCIGCGNCGHACAWYLVSNDPKYHPKTRADVVRNIYKTYIDPLGKIKANLGLIKKPTVKDLEDMRDAMWACTTCGRCTLACMQGVSSRRMIRIARTAYDAAGIQPPIVQKIKNDCIVHHHSFGSTKEEVFGRVLPVLQKAGVQVPIDVVGAEYLWICSAIGNTKVYETEAAVMVGMLNAMGINYTISSQIVDTGTEMQAVVGNRALTKQYLERIEEQAKRLHVKGILLPECACDIRELIVEASDVLGRQFEFPIAYVDTLAINSINSGKIPVEKVEMTATYHDPCWTSRLTGYVEEPRDLLKKVVTNFVEMTPNREYNYCCNAGAGPLRMFPSTEGEINLRQKVSILKAKQIEATNADAVLTPCATCYLSLKDIVKVYNLKTKAESLISVVYKAMMNALTKEGKTDIVKFPVNYDKIPESFRYIKKV
ncbi:conserved hypothetical protein [groundwater metagenome]|uniref:4Fe-4S ferredoxin-type domain-containing protein n=1 Tax=groundwater metagenome TaxID=717931 RepID=A0A098EC22_9ZZZZ